MVLQQIKSSSFTPGAYEFPSHGFLTGFTIQARASSCAVGLKSNQNVFNYSHKMHTIIAPNGHIQPSGPYCSSNCSQLTKTFDHSSPTAALYSTYQGCESQQAERKLPGQCQLDFPIFCSQSVWCLLVQDLSPKLWQATKCNDNSMYICFGFLGYP